MEYEVRELTAPEMEDSGALPLIHRVFLEFEAPEYSDEGIREFEDYIAPAAIRDRMRTGGMIMWGCFCAGSLTGVLAVRPAGHVSLLFVDKAFHRKGAARALYEAALSWHKSRTELQDMTVNSSPYAQDAYHRLGFVDTGPEQTVNGLRFIPMKHTFR